MTATLRTATVVLALLGALVVLGSCRRAPEPEPIEGTPGDFSSMELPDDPLPPFPGTAPEAIRQRDGRSLIHTSPAPPDRVVEYYDNVFSRRGWTVHPAPGTPPDMRLASYVSGDQVVLLRVTQGADGQSTVQLYRSEWHPRSQ